MSSKLNDTRIADLETVRIDSLRFFTLENYRADGDDDVELALMRSAYRASTAHLQELRRRHPSDVWEIADPFFVDDALLVEVRYDRKADRMEIVLRCGNLFSEYFDLLLKYDCVEISQQSEYALATVARATRTCTRYWDHDCYVHELDLLDDGRFVHHCLFHPGLAITIICSALTWERIPRPDRTLPRRKNRFPGGPMTPPPSLDGYRSPLDAT